MANRRELLRFLAASPLLAGLSLDALGQEAQLSAAADALDVFEFEAMARRVLPPAHWGFMATGVDGDETLRANSAGFARYQLRPRRFIDVSNIVMSVELFGERFSSPIMFSPVSSLQAFHAEGEVGAAKAARARSQLQMLSTRSSLSVEDVGEARGSPIWFQLYTTNSFDVTKALLRRAERAGCHVVAITVDLPAGRNTVTAGRLRRQDTRVCTDCHGPTGPGNTNKPNFAGIDMTNITTTSATLTWDFIKRVKDLTTMKVIIKGLETREDASLAVENGADGIIVSNHGGRATETNRATIEALPEVLEGAAGRIPVLVDGGFRRGTDVFKALALGARAVGVGRPYVWGLSCFGQAGVHRVLEILDNELRLAMVGCGTRTLDETGRDAIVDTARG